MLVNESDLVVQVDHTNRDPHAVDAMITVIETKTRSMSMSLTCTMQDWEARSWWGSPSVLRSHVRQRDY